MTYPENMNDADTVFMDALVRPFPPEQLEKKGEFTYIRPASKALRMTGQGYSPLSSYCASTGRISSRAKLRAIS